MGKKTVKDIDLAGKRVLLRADYNVPDIAGKITDDFRIKQSVPTIEYILKQKAKGLVIMSHLGRPKGVDKSLSLQPIAKHLSQLLDRRVQFVPDCVGDGVKEAASRLNEGDILMLENLRFHTEEEKNDPEFAKTLVDVTDAEVFVQDGFGVVHRAHASTEAITKFLPSVAGLLLQKEVETITKIMKDPKHPLVAVIGGAKIADKIDVLQKLIDLADCLAVGGAMANNFLKIEGHSIGKSLYDKADLEAAKDVLQKAQSKAQKEAFHLLLPVDAVVSKSSDGRSATRAVDITSHSLSDIEAYPKIPKREAYSIAKDEAILDIGPISAARIAGIIGLAKTVIWNGTMGVTETKGIAGAEAPFAHGTTMIVEAIIGPHNKHPVRPFSLVGGGDTVGYIEAEGLTDDFDHVSTGGGASLELMSGKKLPGYEALQNKN
ncbi:MAG TPA: phosphoglycerate kinase [Candidatus Saccharimonadales bacterium]|nr:phosphoglycerate kinase [Candidatus Saccharimonadales bacterium]